MRCADIIMQLRFLNLARARDWLFPPTSGAEFPLPEIASGGAEAEGRVTSRRGRRRGEGDSCRGEDGKEGEGGEGGEVGGEAGGQEVEGAEEAAGQEVGGGGSVGRSDRCGDARGEARAARNGSNARGATGEGEGGGDGGAGCTAEDEVRREGTCGGEGSSPARLAPSGPPCVGWAGLKVRCSATEEKLASSPAPVREVDEEASELRTEVGGGLTLPIGKEAGEALPSASTAADLGG